jgi:hypothetical protein
MSVAIVFYVLNTTRFKSYFKVQCYLGIYQLFISF